MDDIDWRRGEITVRGKGNRHDRLPLPADVGQRIIDWLHDGRPAAAQAKTVFVRAQAPYRALTSNAVTTVVACAGRRAGLGPIGAHRLRHSAATAMFDEGRKDCPPPFAGIGGTPQPPRHLPVTGP